LIVSKISEGIACGTRFAITQKSANSGEFRLPIVQDEGSLAFISSQDR
jgi:hypothetical protein